MLQALIGPVTGLLDKVIEDKDQKAKLAHEIATLWLNGKRMKRQWRRFLQTARKQNTSQSGCPDGDPSSVGHVRNLAWHITLCLLRLIRFGVALVWRGDT